MYLEKLEIQGFKSFAHKNKLVFSGLLSDKKRGITVIVGPNGSGKSNLADAIRWALGEQSAKLLRGRKSEDVIFSGSDQKGRLNLAEVSLFFNNEDANFFDRRKTSEEEKSSQGEGDNIDALLLSPEIVLTRRVFRDGNSEYFINNSKVRLSDVQIFLAKANFGQKTYSVIGQGMVENFLNTSPAERKVFFDEATGVKQYQIKRDLSLNKLENSQENLFKVEMLLNEIEPRLKSLTRQVSKLKKRQFLEEELLKNQLNYYSRIWREISGRLNEAQSAIKAIEGEQSGLDRQLSENRMKLDEISRSETVGEEFYRQQKRLLFLKTEQARAEKQLERISEYARMERIEREKTADLSWKSVQDEKDSLMEEIKNRERELTGLKSGCPDRSELKEMEDRLIELEKKRSEQYRELAKIEAWMEVKLEKQGKFDLAFLNNRLAELKIIANQTADDSQSQSQTFKAAEEKIAGLEKSKIELEEKLNESEAELNRLLSDQPDYMDRIKQSLKGLLKKTEADQIWDDFSSLRKVMTEIKEDLKKLLNLSSGQEYRLKTEIIQKRIGRLREEQKKIDDEIINSRTEYNSVTGRLSHLNRYLAQLKQEISSITQKIEFNQNDGPGEDCGERKKELEKEIESHNRLLEELKRKIFDWQSLENVWQERKTKIQDELQNKQSRLNEISGQNNLVATELLKIQSRLEDLKSEIKDNIFSTSGEISRPDFFETETDYLKKFIKENDSELAGLQAKIDNFNQEQENQKRNLIARQSEIRDLENRSDRLQHNLNEHKISLAREETRLEELQNNLADDQLDLDRIKRHQIEAEFELEIVRAEIGRLKNQLELIGGLDPEIEKEYEETRKRYDWLFEQTEDLNRTIRSLEKVIVELDVLIKDRFESEFKIISEKFNEYFKILFNGGRAKIFPIKDDPIEEDRKDGDNTQAKKEGEENRNAKMIKRLKKYNALGLAGVDISATPPGKKISSVNVLSGGERALTAIALICAIISANPSPFVVLDEVDAALDESNSARLAKILDDLSNQTQFIAISHNRATMKKANILYGVTMRNDGISQLLSVKLDEY